MNHGPPATDLPRHQRPGGNLDLPRLLAAYDTMLRIRAFEEEAVSAQKQGLVLGAIHPSIGQEAVASGVCLNLGRNDVLLTTHRGHGHALAKGADANAMMCELLGREGGTCHGKGGSMHIADLSKGMMGANGIVGGGPPLICGAALSAKYLKTGGVAVAFIGDGASNQGTTHESFNLANVWKLPAIFVVEDNGYAEATASKWSVAGNQVDRAKGYGMPAYEVDGHDFFAVWEAAREAIERARDGGGPSLIHSRLNRYYGHFEGDAMSYRAPGEVEKVRAEKDPLMLFRNRVSEAGLLDGPAMDAVDKASRDRIAQVLAEAKAGALPTEADLLTDVYTSAY